VRSALAKLVGQVRCPAYALPAGSNFFKNNFFNDFFLFILGYLVEFFGNFLDTVLGPASPRPGANLVALTTSDPWVGFLKFCWLDILEFAWLHAGGSGFVGKNHAKLKKIQKNVYYVVTHRGISFLYGRI
jgi:hypothetical protein